MQFNALKELLRRGDITPGAKILYQALLMFRNATTGQCNPQHRTLGDACGMNRATIRRHLDALKAAGMVEIERHQHGCSYTLPEAAKLNISDGAKLNISSGQMAQKSYPDVAKPAIPNRGTELLEELGTPPPPPTPAGAREANKSALILVKEWDTLFPTTTLGADRIQDINALSSLLCDGYSADRLRKAMQWLKANGKVAFYKRPYRLIKRTDQGNGILVIADIETNMEAAQANTAPAARESAVERGRRELEEWRAKQPKRGQHAT